MSSNLQMQPASKSQYQQMNNIVSPKAVQPMQPNNQSYPAQPTPSPFMPGSTLPAQQPIMTSTYQSQPPPPLAQVCPFCFACQKHAQGQQGPNASQPGQGQKRPTNELDYEYGVCEDCQEEINDPDDPIDMENAKLRDDMAKKAKENRNLRNRVAQLQTELDRIKHLPEENDKLKAMLGPLEDQLNKARRDNKDLLDDNKRLGDQVGNLKKNIDQANNAAKDNENMKKEIDDLKKKAKEGEKVMDENKDLKDRLGKLKGDRDKMLADLAALEKQNGGLKNRLGALAKEKDDLVGEVGKLKKINADLDKKCHDLQLDNDNLHLNLDDANGKNKDAMIRLDDLHKNRNQLLNELGPLRQKVADIEKANDDLKKQNNALVGDAKKGQDAPKLKRQVDILTHQMEDLKAEKDEQDKHLEYLHQELDKALKILEKYNLLPLMDENYTGRPSGDLEIPTYDGNPQPRSGQYPQSGQFPGQQGQSQFPGGPGFGQYQGQPGQNQFQGQPYAGQVPQGAQTVYPTQYGVQSTLMGTPNPQFTKMNGTPGNMGSTHWGGASGNRLSYEELLQDNVRMKKVIDQLNADLKGNRK